MAQRVLMVSLGSIAPCWVDEKTRRATADGSESHTGSMAHFTYWRLDFLLIVKWER